MSYLENLKTEANYTRTLNGAKTHGSTGDACLDVFAVAGGMRPPQSKEIYSSSCSILRGADRGFNAWQSSDKRRDCRERPRHDAYRQSGGVSDVGPGGSYIRAAADMHMASGPESAAAFTWTSALIVPASMLLEVPPVKASGSVSAITHSPQTFMTR